ncbi:MAG: Mur ligase family protein, partial [bacterium]
MKTIAALCADIECTIIGDPQTVITGISYDSRKVLPGDLFACLAGAKVDSHSLIPQVLAAGAVALLVEHVDVVPVGVPAILVRDTRAALALLAAAFYDHPADHLTLVGVTGTNGKTTVTTLLRHVLQTSGHPTGLIGTLAYRIGDEVIPAPHTTPQAPELQQLLARMRDAGLSHVAMEVSSHALCLHRITGCRFRFAALTNLTQDHLDYHQTIAA